MQLEVESAGVADGLAVVVAPPERGVGGAAVRARHSYATVTVGGLEGDQRETINQPYSLDDYHNYASNER